MSGCKESSRPPTPALPAAPAVWGARPAQGLGAAQPRAGECALQVMQNAGRAFPSPSHGPACYVETQNMAGSWSLREIYLPHDGDLRRARGGR